MRLARSGAALVLACAGSAAVAVDVSQLDYGCERGAQVAAIYISDTDPALAILQIEVRQVVFQNVPSGSGARYAEDPAREVGYIWWTKGDEAFLTWHAEDGQETDLLRDCRITPTE